MDTQLHLPKSNTTAPAPKSAPTMPSQQVQTTSPAVHTVKKPQEHATIVASTPHTAAPIAAPNSLQSPIEPTPSKQQLQWWWLLLIPALLLCMLAGWFLGQYKERRQHHHDSDAPKALPVITPEINTKNVAQTQKKSIHQQKAYQPKHEVQTLDVYKAYRFFLFRKYDDAIKILHDVYQLDPFDANPYLMSIRILSESERPLPELERLLKTGAFLIRNKHPALWQEVASSGREFLPDWDLWDNDRKQSA